MSRFIWLHEDCLRATHPVFAHAPQARAVFIWDDAYMDAMHYGLKRRVFIYETLCDLPVEIYAGDTIDTWRALQNMAGASDIITGKTPNPALKAMMPTLREGLQLTTIADAPFVHLDAAKDDAGQLRRFFKYWNKAKKNAFLYDGRP